jgi:hypothetical protein
LLEAVSVTEWGEVACMSDPFEHRSTDLSRSHRHSSNR